MRLFSMHLINNEQHDDVLGFSMQTKRAHTKCSASRSHAMFRHVIMSVNVYIYIYIYISLCTYTYVYMCIHIFPKLGLPSRVLISFVVIIYVNRLFQRGVWLAKGAQRMPQ